jgi:hypothetical protein
MIESAAFRSRRLFKGAARHTPSPSASVSVGPLGTDTGERVSLDLQAREERQL